ncbi:MAG: hypothetical protein LIO79_07025 [Rikenellaceae bacterium]|nr:hypothetical protein [Rikenellaceae bacterium]
MKKIINHIRYIAAVLVCVLIASCTKEESAESFTDSEGALLNLAVSFKSFTGTKLAELPDGNAMADSVINGTNYGLYNVSLYIYYTDDYNNNDLLKPYIRNMECTVEDGRLIPVLAEGEDAANRNIFIYDQMTIVAFYPYNAEMSDPDNYFSVKTDEDNYPITRNDYSE